MLMRESRTSMFTLTTSWWFWLTGLASAGSCRAVGFSPCSDITSGNRFELIFITFLTNLYVMFNTMKSYTEITALLRSFTPVGLGSCLRTWHLSDAFGFSLTVGKVVVVWRGRPWWSVILVVRPLSDCVRSQIENSVCKSK